MVASNKTVFPVGVDPRVITLSLDGINLVIQLKRLHSSVRKLRDSYEKHTDPPSRCEKRLSKIERPDHTPKKLSEGERKIMDDVGEIEERTNGVIAHQLIESQ